MDGPQASKPLTTEDWQAVLAAIPTSAWNQQRWFGGKGRKIAWMTLRDYCCPPALGHSALALIDFEFEDGGTETYLVPLSMRTARAEPGDFGQCLISETNYAVSDGLVDICPALLELMRDREVLNCTNGRMRFDGTDVFQEIVSTAVKQGLRIKQFPAHQSNTLIGFNDRAVLKCYRKLVPGVNPDLEVPYFLTTQTGYQNIPRVAGIVEYEGADGGRWPLAALQSFVPNQGNAWELALSSLAALYASGEMESAALIEQFAEYARKLGERTGELHAALASGQNDQAFTPEPMTDSDHVAWKATLLVELAETTKQLRAGLARVPAALRTQCEQVLAADGRMQEWIGSATFAGGMMKIRIHGDYHLGQVLVAGDDFVIIDFEGEPARPLEQRRAKQPALKDVAGMMRSFNYAGFAALFAKNTASQEQLDPLRDRWEAQAREAFLVGYKSAVASSPAAIVPTADEQFAAMLSFFELEKALYEVRYELNNRPDWLAVPLGGIRQRRESTR